jgi:imidazolonepropionase-like amidohydrolase
MSTLYAGGLLFDGDQPPRPGLGVLVSEQLIETVAPLGDFDGFEGCRVDSTGGTLLPGLFDCHVHLCYDGAADPYSAMAKSSDAQIVVRALQHAQATLRGGVTSTRDCGGKDYLEFAVRDACNRGELPGPTIRAAGRMICMTGGHGNRMGRVADGADEVIKAVREQIHAGCDFVKIMATGGVMTPGVNPEDAHYSAEEMAAGIRESQRFHRHTASHAQGRDGILNAVRGGIDSIEHGIFMDQVCCDEMKKAGTYLVPTLSAVNNILRYADQGIPAYAVEKSQRVAERHRASVKMYYEAGGRIAMGTDAGTPFNYHGENVLELEYMVDIGISPLDALISSTSTAADLLREKERGRIRSGNFADFLLVDGNPSESISMVSRKENHRLVVKHGTII